jgi:hypothetical protein
MLKRSRRRRAAIGAVVVIVALGGGNAAAHSFPGWSGTSGPFAWQAKKLSCGIVGEQPSQIRAHSLWRTSPANGYQRLTFTRQIRNDATGTWATVQRQRRSTKNTRLEGNRDILHWTQFFFPFDNEAGKTSRVIVAFEWLRDRAGTDRRVGARKLTLKPCVVDD